MSTFYSPAVILVKLTLKKTLLEPQFLGFNFDVRTYADGVKREKDN